MPYMGLDTEGLGLDLYHGCMPFLVTIGIEDEDGKVENKWWEWDVDPLTRRPIIIDEDIEEIKADLAVGWCSEDGFVLQNPKFDCQALLAIGIDEWHWENVNDTLIAGHALATNQAHDLTSMAVEYLGVNIQPFEDKVKEACVKARNIARTKYPDWRIAKAGLPEMPSAKSSKEGAWKADMWLPRRLAMELGYPDDHPWWTVTADYANADSSIIIPLWKVMKEELIRQDLWEYYIERLQSPRISHKMENRGITYSGARLEELHSEYKDESERAGKVCVNIAAHFYDYDLTLPKSGNNKSLRTFVFDVMKLPQYEWSEKTGEPSLNKDAFAKYELTLPPQSPQLAFIKSLSGKRKRDTAITYMDGYRRFGIPIERENGGRFRIDNVWIPVHITNEDTGAGWYVLHPNLNPTGTDTLRWSSSNPNSQNISRKEGFNLRYIYGPGPGRELWSLDGKNMELRVPAYEAEEEAFINLFEHPDDPPYFGSNHLLVASIIFQKEFEECLKRGGNFKKDYIGLYDRVKRFDFACVPMDTMALTRNGWKSYSQIEVGDLVAGYKEGALVWTPVLKKVFYEKAPIMEIRNKHFKARTTPNHRWKGTVRTGRGRTRRLVERFFTTEMVNGAHNIRVSAPMDDEGLLGISPAEAAVIALVYCEGTIVKGKFVGANVQMKGKKVKFLAKIYQSKQFGVDYIDEVMKEWGGGFTRNVEKSGITSWTLRSEDARNLWRKAGLYSERSKYDEDFEKFVLNLGTECRTKFLEAALVAEGTMSVSKSLPIKGDKERPSYYIFTQNKGKLADAVRLAIFMDGKFPTTQEKKSYYEGAKEHINIRGSRPFVSGQKIKKKVLPREDVWCIKTECDTWVMKQGDLIMLTGNTQYDAGDATADAAAGVPGARAMVKDKFVKQERLSRHYRSFANKHGYVETIPDKTVNPRRGFPILCARTEYGRVKPTVPFSYHIQGTVGWWMQKCMNRCDDYLSDLNRRLIKEGKIVKDEYFMVMQVHDELVFDFPKGKGKEPWKTNLPYIRDLQKLMEKGGDDIDVPVSVSIEYHEHNWSEGVSIT